LNGTGLVPFSSSEIVTAVISALIGAASTAVIFLYLLRRNQRSAFPVVVGRYNAFVQLSSEGDANLRMQYEITALQDGISAWERGLAIDGDVQDIQARMAPIGRVNIVETERGKYRIIFDRPLKRGNSYVLDLQFRVIGGFREEREFWITSFNFPVRHFELVLRFPEDRQPKSLVVLRGQGPVLEEIENAVMLSPDDYRVQLSQIVSGSSVEVRWTW